MLPRWFTGLLSTVVAVLAIPVLLLRGWGIEKSIQFREFVYVGSPINAARVFNGRNVDELVLLDIDASREGRTCHTEIIAQIAAADRVVAAAAVDQRRHPNLSGGAACNNIIVDPQSARISDAPTRPVERNFARHFNRRGACEAQTFP